MERADSLRPSLSLVPNVNGRNRHLRHPLNGRFAPLDHARLAGLVDVLVAAVDVRAVDYVVGFPEGGSIPAYAFAARVDRPVLLSSQITLDLPAVTFAAPNSSLASQARYLYGVTRGDRVLIIEDEITTGLGVVAAVRALRAAGIDADEVGTLLAIDHPALRARMAAEKITLHVGQWLPPEYAARPLDPPP
jgi:orotate phosphoribosyltransferase